MKLHVFKSNTNQSTDIFRMKKNYTLLFCFILFFTPAIFATTYLVQQGTGASWSGVAGTVVNLSTVNGGGAVSLNAWFTDKILATPTFAGSALASGDEIWIINGTYYLTGPVGIKGGVKMYGGFAGTAGETVATRAKNSSDAWDFTNATAFDGSVTGVKTYIGLSGGSGTTGTLIDGITIQNCKNSATSQSGAGVKLTGSGTTLQNCIITACTTNSTTGSGVCGGISITGAATLKDSYIHHNSSTATVTTGGGVNVMGDLCTVSGCKIDYNTSTAGGAGLYIYSTTSGASISNCSFSNNAADGSGGAIGCYVPATNASPITITNCTFSSNSAAGTGGGAVQLYSTVSTNVFTVSGCTFTSNTGTGTTASTSNGGGALMLMIADYSINNCIFSNNSTVQNSGGAILIASASACTISNTKFIENTSGTTTASQGSAIYSKTIYTANNCLFSGNIGTSIVHFYTAATASVFQNCTFASNLTSLGAASPIALTNLTPKYSFTNCLFYASSTFSGQTPTLSYCGFDIAIPSGGTNCITGITSASFKDATNVTVASRDYTLAYGSSAIDAGTTIAACTPDILGISRPQCGAFDLGAYETNAASTLTTTAASSIANTTATSGANVTVGSCSAITARGVCWSTVTSPTVSDSHTSDGGTTGSFSSSLTGLLPGYQYFVRGYATSAQGTTYGSEINFTTTGSSLPTLAATTSVTNIISPTATSGGNVSSANGAAITARGVCWSTSHNPTTADSKTTDAGTTGSYTSSLTGLSSNATYYVRAYATNAAGTAYGTEVSFSTLKPEPTNQATSFAKGASLSLAMAPTFTAAVAGAQAPDGYLLKLSTSAIVAPVDGVDPSDATVLSGGIANVKVTASPCTSITGLTAGTFYNCALYSYTNAGTSINFNTTSAPTINTATAPYSNIPAISANSTTTAIISFPAITNVNNSFVIFMKHTSAVTKGTPSVAPSTYTANAAFGSGTAFQNDAAAYCVYKGSGTSVTVTGLTTNDTYQILAYVIMNSSNSDGTYTYSYGRTASVVISGKAEPTNQPTSFTHGTVTTSAIPLTWTASVAGAQSPDGYLVKLNTGAVVDPVDGTDPADVTTVTSNAANLKVPLDTAFYANSFDGLVAGTMYNYNIYSYTNSGAYINFKTSSIPSFHVATLPNPVTSGTLTYTSGTTATLAWSAASGYSSGNHSTLVFLKAGSAITQGTPTNDPSTYSDVANFAGAGTAYQGDASAKCVYKGDGTSVAITGLDANTTYYALIYTVVDATNSNSTNSYSSAVIPLAVQAITFSALAGKTYGDAPYTVSATGGRSGNAVVFTSSDAAVATCTGTNGTTVSIIGAGSCTIYANQAGDSYHSAATQVGQSLVVSKANQTITFAALSDKTDSDLPFSLTGTSSSGLTLSYTSSNTAVATVSGTTLTIIAAGTTNITASRALDGNFNAAADVIRSLTVTSTPPITIPNTGTTLSSSLLTSSTCDVIIPSGGTLSVDAAMTVRDLTVAAGGKLDLSASLNVLGNLIFKDDATGSFSAYVGSSGITVTGSIYYYKSIDNTKWHFVSFPCDVLLTNIKKSDGSAMGTLNTDWFLKYYDGARRVTLAAGSNWANVTAGATPTKLNAYQGYILGLADGQPLTEIRFPLASAVVTSEPAHNVSVVAHGSALAIADNHKGWNLVGQPYLSNYDLKGINATYMTRWSGIAYTDWSHFDTANLRPFEAFFVQADDALASSNMTFSLGSRQSVRAAVSNDLSDRVQLNFTTETGTDRTNVIIDESESAAYQINHDLEKWITTANLPQIYTNLGGVNYAFNALPMGNAQNLAVGVYSKTAGTSTISADLSNATGISQLLLTDHVDNVTTDLLTSDYNFTASAGTTNSRFTLSAQRVATTTGIVDTAFNAPQLLVVNGVLLVKNITERTKIKIFDTLGRLLASKEIANNSLELPFSGSGLFTVVVQAKEKAWVKKLVIR